MKKILAIFFLLVGQLAVAQDPYYYLIDKSKGLPSNSVYDVFQDKIGYMWFATDEGICRYDGAKFVTYYSEQQTSRAGSCISQDKYGRIWYSNFDGYLYYIEQGKLKPLRNIKPRGYFRYGIANDFLYVVTERGVAIYSLKNLQVVAEIYLNDKTLSAANMINDKFYILGAFLYEISEGKLLRKLSFPQNIKQSSIHPVIIQSSPKGIYFVSKNTKYIHLLSSNGSIKSME
ncbi:two-component regulator propeller domain-containing protein, partial [Pedobacter sp.]